MLEQRFNKEQQPTTEKKSVTQAIANRSQQADGPQTKQADEQQIDAAAAIMLTEARKQANRQGVALTTLLPERFKEAIRSLGIPL